jgi:hypothetical protein
MHRLAQCARAFPMHDSHTTQPALRAGLEIFFEQAGGILGSERVQIQFSRDGNPERGRFITGRHAEYLSLWRLAVATKNPPLAGAGF